MFLRNLVSSFYVFMIKLEFEDENDQLINCSLNTLILDFKTYCNIVLLSRKMIILNLFKITSIILSE